MGAGVATPASCAKRAFEKQGHTVFLFTPNMWPELFDEAGTFDATSLSRFFEVQRPDCLMLAEGIGACGLDAAASRGVAVGMLAAAPSEAEASVAKSSGAPFDFAIMISGRSLRLEEVDGFEGVVGACAPAVDAAYASTPIANLVAFGPGIMCLQDATPARVAFFDKLVADGRFGGAVRCFGASWPERFASDPTFTHIAYSARSSAACVVFGDLDEGAQDADEKILKRFARRRRKCSGRCALDGRGACSCPRRWGEACVRGRGPCPMARRADGYLREGPCLRARGAHRGGCRSAIERCCVREPPPSRRFAGSLP